MSIGVAILGLAVLILLHEAGHFFVARAVGMRPRKFYLGFPPALVKTTRGGIEYGIGAIPLGGYVKIPGMHRPAAGDLRASLTPAQQQEHTQELDVLDAALAREDETAARTQLAALEPELGKNRILQEQLDALSPDAYWRQKTWKRIAVIGAGPGTNIVIALVLFVIVFMSASLTLTRTVHSVLKGHPAAAAGLKAGDQIVDVAGRSVAPDGLQTAINGTHGHPFTLVVIRNGHRITLGPLKAQLQDGSYRVGFVIGTKKGPGQSLSSAVGSSLHLTRSITTGTLNGIWGLTHGQGTHNVSSVVGIVRDTAQAYRASFQDYVYFVGAISLVLALANLLPLLPFDGGHIVMSALEGVRHRAFSQLAYMRYSAVGMVVFMFLLYLGLRNDVTSGG